MSNGVSVLMSHEERRKLIETPIIVRVIGTHYGWGGIMTSTRSTGPKDWSTGSADYDGNHNYQNLEEA